VNSRRQSIPALDRFIKDGEKNSVAKGVPDLKLY
jgi:hypothetical protein